MDSLAATFDEIRDAYALGRSGPPRQVGERVWHLPTDDGGVAIKLYASEHHARAAKEAAVLAHFETHGDTRFHVQVLKRTAAGTPMWTGSNAHANDRAGNQRRYVDLALRLLDRYYPGSIDAFPADDPQHPIHNDYNQFNYLFTGTLPPLILDWEASIGAPREYELVRCLNHLPLEAPHLAEAFVQAYRRTRPVDPARIAWAVDAACLQHALKLWIVQGWLDDPSRFASHLSGAVTMASAMVDARDRLVDFFSRCIEAGR